MLEIWTGVGGILLAEEAEYKMWFGESWTNEQRVKRRKELENGSKTKFNFPLYKNISFKEYYENYLMIEDQNGNFIKPLLRDIEWEFMKQAFIEDNIKELWKDK